MIGIYIVDFKITVSSGAGSKVFDEQGDVVSICIKAPSAVAVYKYQVKDADSFGRLGTPYSKTGDHADNTLKVPLLGKNTFSFSEATDGLYEVRLYIKYKYGD